MRQSATSTESELQPAELAALQALLKSAQLSGTHLEAGTAAGGTLGELRGRSVTSAGTACAGAGKATDASE